MIKPINKKILVEILSNDKKEVKTDGGLFIPASEATKNNSPRGIVLAVADDCEVLKVGDEVVYYARQGHAVKQDGKDCLIMKEDDVIYVDVLNIHKED